MSEPIDFENRDQVLRLALSAVFMTTMIARGNSASTACAKAAVECADALINAVVTPPP